MARPEPLPLTPYQLRILDYLANGLDEFEAADALGVSREAVNDQMRRVRSQLAAKNQAHAVAIALRLGLIR